MSEIRLFRLLGDQVQPIAGTAVAVEKSLQTLIEAHLEALLGVRFLASEYSTTKSHAGRIDTLGIDESNCPVIIEYKRALNENVINQGLFCLDWLLDHRADFTLLVMNKLGADDAKVIDWRAPRLICIAGDFTKYDQHAIQQMPRNIDLIRYRRYGDDLLLLEQVAVHSIEGLIKQTAKGSLVSEPGSRSEVLQRLDQCSPDVRDWFEQLRAHSLSLGAGVHEHIVDRYIAFRSIKNFARVHFRPSADLIVIELTLDEATIKAQSGFVHQRGKRWPHIEIANAEDISRALPLLQQSYYRTT